MLTSTSPLSAYYAALDAGDADACAALFAAEALCIRQALAPDLSLRPGVDVIRGRSAIRAYVAARPRRAAFHTIRSEIAGGSGVCVEGIYGSGPDDAGSLFLATAHLDSEGLIWRYMAIGTQVREVDARVLAERPGHRAMGEE